MKKIFITGMSGTGKSALAEELKRRGLDVFDIDKIMGSCNWYDNATCEVVDYHPGVGKQWLYEHSWNADFKKIGEKIESCAEAEVVFVVGITTNQEEFIDQFDQVFVLQLDDDALRERLVNRDTNDFAKDGEEQDYIMETKQDFEDRMRAHGAIFLDATKTVDKLVDEILDNLKVNL